MRLQSRTFPSTLASIATQSVNIPFDNTYIQLPDSFYVPQRPAHVPDPKLVLLNPELAAKLAIDAKWAESKAGIDAFSGNAVPDGAQPLAQAYAGHQFGNFVPQLGDGRAILLGEIIASDGRRYDLQLKGSGRTAFSRNGDGKSALGPVVREFIVSEAMAALGVPTTRALAAVATGERVARQEGMMPGGVFTRVASSHLRVGTFQYFQSRNDIASLKILADYAINRHYPQAAKAENPYLSFLELLLFAQADLIAHWMSIGFIHGVMNTDNCAISGETIDYGPCAFMDNFHPQCVFSSIDTHGRYAWGSQAEIGLWNITRLAEALLPLIAEDQSVAIKLAETVLAKYEVRFGDQYSARFRSKFCLPSDAPFTLVKDCLALLANQEVDFTAFFRQLTRVASGTDSASLLALFSNQGPIIDWRIKWEKSADPQHCLDAMRLANPIRIPRNHRVEQAIQAAYADNFAPAKKLIAALADPYSEDSAFEAYENPPLPHEVVHHTFCGT